jgi:hypothetical protein
MLVFSSLESTKSLGPSGFPSHRPAYRSKIGPAFSAKRVADTAGGHHFVQISAGQYHTCALKSDGSLACWGFNGEGALDNIEDLVLHHSGLVANRHHDVAFRKFAEMTAANDGAPFEEAHTATWKLYELGHLKLVGKGDRLIVRACIAPAERRAVAKQNRPLAAYWRRTVFAARWGGTEREREADRQGGEKGGAAFWVRRANVLR